MKRRVYNKWKHKFETHIAKREISGGFTDFGKPVTGKQLYNMYRVMRNTGMTFAVMSDAMERANIQPDKRYIVLTSQYFYYWRMQIILLQDYEMYRVYCMKHLTPPIKGHIRRH